MKIERGKKRSWDIAFAALMLIIVSSVITYTYVSEKAERRILAMERNMLISRVTETNAVKSKPAFNLSLSTHFDAWEDWQDALVNVLNRQGIGMTDIVGVGAGRPEWIYFKWKGREEVWANHQKAEKKDLLLNATEIYKKMEIRVAAIIDVFAPKYIKHHPGAAAVRYDGQVSDMQVSLAELTEGEYSGIVLDMVEFICKNYPVDIINFTEMTYYDYSFGKEDLRSYMKHTGLEGWPLDSRGMIDKEDPSVWEWKSVMMERFIEKAARIVHRSGKELYVDVPVSWKDFSRNGSESGLDYRKVLDHADMIIVWNYFPLEHEPPSVSRDLARYLVDNFPISTFYLSIGLWGVKGTLDPGSFSEAVRTSLDGGAVNLWLTPNHLVTERHWDNLLRYWKSEKR